jgi:hypothetical protein
MGKKIIVILMLAVILSVLIPGAAAQVEGNRTTEVTVTGEPMSLKGGEDAPGHGSNIAIGYVNVTLVEPEYDWSITGLVSYTQFSLAGIFESIAAFVSGIFGLG